MANVRNVLARTSCRRRRRRCALRTLIADRETRFHAIRLLLAGEQLSSMKRGSHRSRAPTRSPVWRSVLERGETRRVAEKIATIKATSSLVPLSSLYFPLFSSLTHLLRCPALFNNFTVKRREGDRANALPRAP